MPWIAAFVVTLGACAPKPEPDASAGASADASTPTAQPEPSPAGSDAGDAAPPLGDEAELAALAQTLELPEACRGQLRAFVPSEAFIDGLVDEPEYFGLYLGTTKIGWAAQTAERVDPSAGQPAAIRIGLEMSVVLVQDLPGEPEKRAELHSTERATFVARAPYPIIEMDNHLQMDDIVETQTFTREGAWLVLTTTNDGTIHRKVFHAFEFGLGEFLASQLWLTQASAELGTGASVTYLDLDLDDDAKHHLGCKRASLVSTEAVWLEGGEQRLRTLEIVSLADPSEAPSTETYNEHGDPLRIETQGFELRSEPEAIAKQVGEGGRISPYSVLSVDRALGDSDTLTRLELVIEGASATNFASTSMQAVHAHEDGVRLILDVRRPFAPASVSDREREHALAESATYPIHDPAIVKLASEAIGDASAPDEKVERLVRFVHTYMNFEHGNGSVLRTLESRSGDCTEVSELFTTLARALGIPARTVGGYGYTNDSMRSFGGHAWNQVLLDGDWISVDATWGQIRADPSHIQESEHADMALEGYPVQVLTIERSG